MGNFGHYSPLCLGVLHLVSSLYILLFDHLHRVNCGVIGPSRLHHEHFAERSLPNDLSKFEECMCAHAQHFHAAPVTVLTPTLTSSKSCTVAPVIMLGAGLLIQRDGLRSPEPNSFLYIPEARKVVTVCASMRKCMCMCMCTCLGPNIFGSKISLATHQKYCREA